MTDNSSLEQGNMAPVLGRQPADANIVVSQARAEPNKPEASNFVGKALLANTGDAFNFHFDDSDCHIVGSTVDVVSEMNVQFWRACHKGNLVVVKALQLLGVDLNAEQEYYWTSTEPLEDQDNIQQDLLSALEFVDLEGEERQHWGISSGFRVGKVPGIFAAIYQRHFKTAEYIVAQNYSQQDFQNDQRRTKQSYHADSKTGGRIYYYKTPDLKVLLRERNAELTSRYTPARRTALYQAVLDKASPALIKKLLTHKRAGDFVETPDCCGRTPLHRSVIHGQTKLVRILLRHGAEVNVLDQKGSSPLLAAAESCPEASAVDVARLLLIHDAVVNLQDQAGKGWVYLHACSREIFQTDH